jgi:N,N'-diacetylbacillosaminyl-diphospho-undecaprenol alpha-1,3-N-acetylgalactosaminyltransferase
VKIALVNNRDFTVWQFRRGLIRRLVAMGHEVVVVTPAGPHVPKLQGLGARHREVRVEPYVDPVGDARFMAQLARVYREERVDLAHHITVKPNVLGSFAARAAGVERIVGLVAGLGDLFGARAGWRAVAVREGALALYRAAFALNYRVWFQNPDDIELFVRRRVLAREKAVLIRGSGVDLSEYSPDAVSPAQVTELRRALGLVDGRPVVLMASRANRSKGVFEFIEAAKRIQVDAHFLLAGDAAWGRDAIPMEEIEARRPARLQWLGFRRDVRELLALADVAVLPSYYPEGVPRVLLEALAMGKPIVTTDMPGCRETVEEGWNGYLVPARNAAALTEAIDRLLRDPDKRAAFGAYSRRKGEREFDERLVVDRVIREVYGLPAQDKISRVADDPSEGFPF